MSEIVPPGPRVIALLVNPNNPKAAPTIRTAQEAACAKGGQLCILKAGTEEKIDAAFETSSNCMPARFFVCKILKGAKPADLPVEQSDQNSSW